MSVSRPAAIRISLELGGSLRTLEPDVRVEALERQFTDTGDAA